MSETERTSAPQLHRFNPYQWTGIAVCVLFSLTMIVNNQLGGEAMWFWYATVFHQGVKLYSQLHIALQPFYVLELNAWMRISGNKIIPIETLSLLHIFAMCWALYLILRESNWPDGLKALLLVGAFALTVSGHSYRFDDYHVVAETFIFFALALLLIIARTESTKKLFQLAAGLGVVSGLTITTRLTDGAALLAASLICLGFLVRKQKLAVIAAVVAVAALTVVLVVHLTGDTFSEYVASSIVRAAGSKGGSGSIVLAPLKMLKHTLVFLYLSKRPTAFLIFMLGLGPVIARFWKGAYKHMFAIVMAALVLLFLVLNHEYKTNMLTGLMISNSVLLLTSLMYLLPVMVLYRLLSAKKNNREWDAREVLVVLPLAEWASYAAGAAAEPLTNYYAPVALLLLLVPVLWPYQKGAFWLKDEFAAYITILTISAMVGKAMIPYSWQNYVYGPMFVNRQTYHHPVYGLMYIDKDLLKFSESVCNDIGTQPGKTQPELLSLPYPFPNYFCATPPWHNYVQTFFDTSTRATIEHLMDELNTAPPQYIVYQRQLNIMNGSERLYNHGKPLAQRDMDKMILQKVASGQWKLLEKSNYLEPKTPHDPGDADWYVIQTR